MPPETAGSHAPAESGFCLGGDRLRDVALNGERKIIAFRIVTTSVLDRHASCTQTCPARRLPHCVWTSVSVTANDVDASLIVTGRDSAQS
jgi:hypothetical protein